MVIWGKQNGLHLTAGGSGLEFEVKAWIFCRLQNKGWSQLCPYCNYGIFKVSVLRITNFQNDYCLLQILNVMLGHAGTHLGWHSKELS